MLKINTSHLHLSANTRFLIGAGLYQLRDYSQLPVSLIGQVAPDFDEKEFARCPCKVLAEIMCEEMGVDNLVCVLFADGTQKVIYRKDIHILDLNERKKPIPKWPLADRKQSKFAGILYARGFPNKRYPETQIFIYPFPNCEVYDGHGKRVGNGTLFDPQTIDQIYLRLGGRAVIKKIKDQVTLQPSVTIIVEDKPEIRVSMYHPSDGIFKPEDHFKKFEDYVAAMKMLKAFMSLKEAKKDMEKKGVF